MIGSFFKDRSLINPPSMTVTSGGSTSLLFTSNYFQRFTGISSQDCVLPDATTCTKGKCFYISNASTGVIVVKYDDGTILKTLVPNSGAFFSVTDVSTTNGEWDIFSGSGSGSGGPAGFTHVAMAKLTSNYSNPGGDANVVYDTIIYDPEGAINLSTGEYTVAQSGFLLVTFQVQLTGGGTEMELKINGSIFSYTTVATGNDESAAILVPVTAGDLVSIGSQSAAVFTGNTPPVNTVAFAQIPNAFAESRVVVSVGNGFGSINTAIRRFSSVDINVGTDITYADSATLGASFTINSDGVYAITAQDLDTANSRYIGISLNATSLNTAISTTSLFERLAITANFPAAPDTAHWTGKLSQGDIIRHHDDGSANGTTIGTNMKIERIG